MRKRLTPGEIRAALRPEQAGVFDAEYRRAVAEASDDLTGVLVLLRRWRRVADGVVPAEQWPGAKARLRP